MAMTTDQAWRRLTNNLRVDRLVRPRDGDPDIGRTLQRTRAIIVSQVARETLGLEVPQGARR